jgi:hypothetical protein
MGLHGKIEHVDGVPHVRCDEALWGVPRLVVRLWPLPSAAGRVDDGDAVYYAGDGYERVTNSRWGTRNYRLPDGGDTKAVMREEIIPPPKTRCRTRWHEGRWQKYHARRGWIDA